jgi:[ribosomal protein S5]-alanine N-acetyltransferase
MELREWLVGEKVRLRLLKESDAEEMLALRTRNRAFFQPFQMVQKDENFALEAVAKQLRDAEVETADDRSYWFGIFEDGKQELVGYVRLSNVVRGGFHNAYIGYMLDEDHNGKGLMTESLRLCISAAFGPLGLHRIQAAIMPHNEPSIRVAEKAGFQREGYARRYLKLNGKWEDHYLYAILADDEER